MYGRRTMRGPHDVRKLQGTAAESCKVLPRVRCPSGRASSDAPLTQVEIPTYAISRAPGRYGGVLRPHWLSRAICTAGCRRPSRGSDHLSQDGDRDCGDSRRRRRPVPWRRRSAYFGYPTAQEDDAEQAIRAGLHLVQWTKQATTGGERLRARVGIATGTVIVGDLA